ncbi:MAG: cadherin-like domain-containing protein [Bacteroidetes bacterium]|nr:cadherin-like domain-containing protein [Bacteroidota bacterium]
MIVLELSVGSAYLFDATTGQLLQTINNPFPDDGDLFGASVAGVGNDKFLIGASFGGNGTIDGGSIHLFDATTSQLLQTINNPSPAGGDRFGISVAGVGNDKFLVGAIFDDTGAENAGSAYLFEITTSPQVNNPPIAVDDFFTVEVNSINNILTVLLNDTDADNDPLAVFSVDPTSTQGGTITNNGNDVTYTPPTSFTGIDSFTYIATDVTDK